MYKHRRNKGKFKEDRLFQKAGGSVMDCMFVSPTNSYFETLIPNMMVFGDEAFGK